jgi:hypothetical protein
MDDQRPGGADPSSGSRPAAPSGAVEPAGFRYDLARRRRERIVAEIERNRRGGHAVPTWALGLALLLVLSGWIAVVVLA